MSDSDHRVYIHFVWTTKYRQPTLVLDMERSVHRIFHSEARKLGCRIVALNGTDDHVHLLIQMGPRVGSARVANQLKGVTTLFINDNRSSESEPLFQWQNGYGAFSVASNQLRPVINYINQQKERHSKDSLWASLEPQSDPSAQSYSLIASGELDRQI